MNPRILIIGLVWPEPTSSAAGWRMLQLIEQLKSLSTDIHFACAASRSESSFDLKTIGLTEHDIVLNSESFNEFVAKLKPDLVVYDRFMTEEQFGWRVKQELPNVLTILDTEDLHFVRRARTQAFKNNTSVNFDTTDCYRELSAIHRCDLSLIISEYEYDLLVDYFKIPPKQLLYLPFVEQEISETERQKLPDFQQREHLMFIGNFIHEPNYQTVLQLKKFWKDIRKQLPKAEVHVYGAYTPEKVYQLHNISEGFLVKGKAEDVHATMQKYKVLVAPIPFGAGLKGKFIDGFKNSLPNVTTLVGSEGMNAENWGGLLAIDNDEFVDAVCRLYQEEMLWKQSVLNGFNIINKKFSEKIWNNVLKDQLFDMMKNPDAHRRDLFVQKMLWQNQLQATKYMSLWIEAKNK